LREIGATVVRVVDGDTLVAETADGTKLRVRLLGIDAPEIERMDRRSGLVSKPGQRFGREAKAFLEKMVLGTTVKLEIHGTDRYRRLLVIVFAPPTFVNFELVRAGLAEYYKGQTPPFYQSVLYDAEQESRAQRRGMWSLGERYESPRAFRARHRIAGE
jgi:endonuclease YncB( thermonuclease family)